MILVEIWSTLPLGDYIITACSHTLLTPASSSPNNSYSILTQYSYLHSIGLPGTHAMFGSTNRRTTDLRPTLQHDQIPQLLEELFSLVMEWFDKDDFIPLYRLGPYASLPVVLAANSADEGSLNKVAASRPVLRSMNGV